MGVSEARERLSAGMVGQTQARRAGRAWEGEARERQGRERLDGLIRSWTLFRGCGGSRVGLVPQLLGACPSADWRPEGGRELGRQGSKKPGKSLGKWRGQTEVVTRSVRPASHSFLL